MELGAKGGWMGWRSNVCEANVALISAALQAQLTPFTNKHVKWWIAWCS